MKLLLLGDQHGNTRWLTTCIDAAAAHDIDYIVQLGDMGYWSHTDAGLAYLKDVQWSLADWSDTLQRPLNLVWIDGNHENHPDLRRRHGPIAKTFATSPEGFWHVRDNIFHAPRGHRWTWDGVTFMSLGGAYSIDKNFRKVGKSWWWEELITPEEADLAMAGGLVDVMFTHDCPDGVQGAIPEHGGLDRQKDRWPESLANRKLLLRVVGQVRPYLLAHGHYHHRNTENLRFPYEDEAGELAWWTTLIEGLACDEMNGNAAIIETAELKRHGVRP